MKPKLYRHGEICFEIIEKLPTELKKSTSKEFLKGSQGHAHSFKGGELYLKEENENIFGYFVANNTKLYHIEHSPEGASLPDGIYRLRRGVEIINKEMKVIID